MVVGGHPFYGQRLGVVLLDARYPRLPGDVGNADTYESPVQFEVVPGLTADRLIHHFDPEILGLVRSTLHRLAKHGATVAVGGCGFFARVHQELREDGPLPFLSSALVQVPWLRMLYGDPVGVLTIDEASLTDQYVESAGWSRSDPVVVQGIDPASLFWHVYFENRDRFDPAVMEADVVRAAVRLAARAPNLRALVLECTNMAPFAAAVQAVVPVPIFDIQGLAHFAARAAHRHRY